MEKPLTLNGCTRERLRLAVQRLEPVIRRARQEGKYAHEFVEDLEIALMALFAVEADRRERVDPFSVNPFGANVSLTNVRGTKYRNKQTGELFAIDCFEDGKVLYHPLEASGLHLDLGLHLSKEEFMATMEPVEEEVP
jgi:hypothetical protein